MPPPPEDQLAQIREAIGRLFERMRDFESRLDQIESRPGAQAAAPPAEEHPPVRAEIVAHEEEPADGSSPSKEQEPAETVASTEHTPAQPPARPPARGLTPAEKLQLAAARDATPEKAAAGSAQAASPDAGKSHLTRPPTFDEKLREKLREQIAGFTWEEFIGGKGAMWAGAIVIILAIAFAIQYVFTKYDLPYLKSASFHAMGLAFLGGGYYLRKQKKAHLLGEALTGLGIFTLYAVAFAGKRMFNPPLWGAWTDTVTFIECCVITLVAVGIAVRVPSVVVVLLGALGGYLTPFVIGGDPPNHVLLFSYLAFLNVTLIASAVLRKWSFLKPLTFAATAGVFLLWIYGPYFIAHRVDLRWSTEWLVVLHAAIFLLGSTIPPVLWRRRSNQFDLSALSASSLWLMGMTWQLFRDHPHQQLALVSWGLALLHLGLFGLTYSRVTNIDRMPRIHLALAAIFFTLAIPLQLEDPSYLALAWAAEGVAFAVVGLWFRDRQMYISSLIVFALSGLHLLGWVMQQEPKIVEGTQLDLRFFIFACTGFLAMLAAASYKWMPGLREREINAWERNSSIVLFMCGNIAVLLGILLQWHNSRMVLALWTLDVAIVWAIGFGMRSQLARLYALLLAATFVGVRIALHGIVNPPEYALLLNSRFGTLVFAGGVFAVVGWLYSRLPAAARGQEQETGNESSLEERHLHVLLGIIGHVLLLTAILCEINSNWVLQYPDTPTRATFILTGFSLAAALYSVALWAVGLLLGYRFYRELAATLGVVVLTKTALMDHNQEAYRVNGLLDIRFLIGEACALLVGLASASYLLPGLRKRFALARDEQQAATLMLGLANVVAMYMMTCQFSSRLVLIVWTLYTGLLWAIAFRRDLLALRWYTAALALAMVGGRMLYHGTSYAEPYRLLANDRFLSLALVAALYFAAGWCYRRLLLGGNDARDEQRLAALEQRGLGQAQARELLEVESQCAPLFGILANVVLVVALSLEIHTWFAVANAAGRLPFPDMGMAEQASYSILWAMYAAGMVVAGFLLRYPLFRYLGLLAFGPILAKVFFVDLAGLDMLPRVLALAVLGVMLLGVAFLYQRFATRILQAPGEEAPPEKDAQPEE